MSPRTVQLLSRTETRPHHPNKVNRHRGSTSPVDFKSGEGFDLQERSELRRHSEGCTFSLP
uniref:Uncharacterized protein n=1 Tax=Arundo donax TaxID=35708 RepID=A0A0A9ABF7_ARUDO